MTRGWNESKSVEYVGDGVQVLVLQKMMLVVKTKPLCISAT